MEVRVSPETLFAVANPLAMAGWIALAVSPFAPRAADRVAAFGIPVLLSLAYAALILAFWAGADGGFDSLPNVMRLFIGAWEVRTARREAIPHLLLLPCLVLTFLFGPIGLLLFLGLRLARRSVSAEAAHG